jgi:hypothetical protein
MELKSYGKAGAIAEEVFSSIRTVLSYNGQSREEKRFDLINKIHIIVDKIFFLLYRYEKHLGEAKRNGIKKGAMNGLTIGSVWFLIYCAYALGM